MEEIYWVGIKESEISCVNFFSGSITYSGSGTNGNLSYVSEYKKILNYNNDSAELDTFVKDNLNELISEKPNVKFMFYNNFYAYYLGNEILQHTICLNNVQTLSFLRDKFKTRFWLSNHVPVLKVVAVSKEEISLKYFNKLFPGVNSYILQGCTGAGGNDTYIIDHTSFDFIKNIIIPNNIYIVSPYLKSSFSVNVHVLIGRDVVLTPASIQIVHEEEKRLVYHGADFIEFQNVPDEIAKKIINYSQKIGDMIKNLGYKGILGIDYIISGNEVFFMEINPRFQSSSSLINYSLYKQNRYSLQEIILNIFRDDNYTIPKLDITIPFSNYIADSYPEYGNYKSYLKNAKHSTSVEVVNLDGYTSECECEKCASLFNIVFNTNITTVNPNGNINIHDNIKAYYAHPNQINNSFDFMELKSKLFTQGIQISDSAAAFFEKNGCRKGTYSSIDLYFTKTAIINCPLNIKLCDMSPFIVDYMNSHLCLKYAETIISNVYVDTDETYKTLKTSHNFFYNDLSFLATDRLRVHHSLGCHFKSNNCGCSFCDVPEQSLTYYIDDLYEVIDWHIDNSEFRHILIGGGAQKRDIEYKRILEIIRYLRTKTEKGIYLMSIPPEDENILDEYYKAGLNEIAFNIELFDRDIAKAYMKGKGNIPTDEYAKMLLKAVELWGDSGNVKSLLIYGLESDESFLNGIEWLASHGIQPIISVFRPLKGTDTENYIPPNGKATNRIYFEALKICQKYNIIPGPDCVYCQNNTLSMPINMFSFCHN